MEILVNIFLIGLGACVLTICILICFGFYKIVKNL